MKLTRFAYSFMASQLEALKDHKQFISEVCQRKKSILNGGKKTVEIAEVNM